MRSKKLCFKCLKPYHRVQDCRKKRACKDCGRKHSSLLPHPPVAGGNANKDQNSAGKRRKNPAEQGREPAAPKINYSFIEVEPVLCGFTGMSKVTVGLPVVPLKVTGIGCEKPVITYAFLDNGSNLTFCTEDLLNELGLKGEETSFSLSTIEKQNSEVKCSVVSLVVHNLQEDEFIDLPSVFSTPALQITRDHIPKQEDVKRWLHLDGIYIPKVEASVGVLIGNDNPKALKPREIEKSRRKGPFVVRTVFGWTMNDPLGRERTRGNHTDNLMKWDFELEEQFKRFCNQEFSDSIVDTDMQMSKDDHKAVAIMEQTAVLSGNHYAMALP